MTAFDVSFGFNLIFMAAVVFLIVGLFSARAAASNYDKSRSDWMERSNEFERKYRRLQAVVASMVEEYDMVGHIHKDC